MTHDPSEKLVEPLTDAEAEEAFIAVVTLLDRLNAAPAATVASKEDEGVAFSLYFSADRVRRLLASIPTPEASEQDALREALDDAVATIAAVRATSVSADDWANSAPHFHDVCGDTLQRIRAALTASPKGHHHD